jgi:hypothetical protein
MSTTVLVLLYAYRTVTVVLRLVDFVRDILVTEYIRTKDRMISVRYGRYKASYQTVCIQPYQNYVRLADNLPGYLKVT